MTFKPHNWPDAIGHNRTLTCIDCGCAVQGVKAVRSCEGPPPVSQVGNHGEPWPEPYREALADRARELETVGIGNNDTWTGPDPSILKGST